MAPPRRAVRRVQALRLVALLATAGMAVSLPLSAASTPNVSSNRLLLASGVVAGLAADGQLVAAHLAQPGCDRILLWKGSGKTKSIAAGCADAEVTSLAVAGARVLWVNYDYGNHAYCQLYTATVARPRRVEIPFCQPDESDTFLGGLAGDRNLLVFNDWFDFLEQGQVRGVELRRVDRRRTTKILGGPAARTVTSVDSGLIAIRGGAGAVTVVRSEGSLVHRFGVKAQTAKLDGSSTVVIKTGTTLTPWDLSTAVDGTPRQMKGGALEDVQSGIAVYILEKAVHLLRLSDGRDVVVRRATSGPVHAQLEAPGLFWSHGATLEFVPMSRVRAALG